MLTNALNSSPPLLPAGVRKSHRHLQSDHMATRFPGLQIDEYLAAQGQQVKRLNMTQPGADAAQLTAEDLAGWSKVGSSSNDELQALL